jgi:hypothetical protein
MAATSAGLRGGGVMEMTSATALLIRAGDQPAVDPDVLTARVSWQDVEAALALEDEIDLVLEIHDMRGDGGAESRTLEVGLDREELARMLADEPGDVMFSFGRADLEEALAASDFEGHGLRERAAVLTIAVAAAATGASAASAFVPSESGGGGGQAVAATASAHDEATLTARGIEATPAVGHDEVGLTGRGIEATPLAATHDEATLASRGIEATPGHDEATLASRGIEATPLAATHDEATLASRGIEATPGHDEATLASRGIEPGPVPASHDEATLVARGIETAPVSGTSGSGLDFPSVDTGTAAIVGGLAGAGLLIVGAGLVARRNRIRPV